MLDKITCSSYKELNDVAINNGYVIYGELDQYTNKFELISISRHKFTFGLMYYDHGIPPQVLLMDNGAKLLIGFEKWIIGMDCINKTVVYKHKAISLFYEFIETDTCILSICELDVFVLSPECRLIWSIGFRDVLETYEVVNNKKISVTCANGDKSEYLLTNGSAL